MKIENLLTYIDTDTLVECMINEDINSPIWKSGKILEVDLIDNTVLFQNNIKNNSKEKWYHFFIKNTFIFRKIN